MGSLFLSLLNNNNNSSSSSSKIKKNKTKWTCMHKSVGKRFADASNEHTFTYSQYRIITIRATIFFASVPLYNRTQKKKCFFLHCRIRKDMVCTLINVPLERYNRMLFCIGSYASRSTQSGIKWKSEKKTLLFSFSICFDR